ncbi:hypothetical protein GCM10010172_43580 [Paractinoplanes ferrugineus]|uniref:Uncharacterized protein n=1 Tax=Paractinoplanes ferrugineus TaxID=113564 RepID=A0A919MBC4_9ACTN|nr:hypothetical protein [Actinoplanes ferrugineus]GIE13516.1 hypothetical protein Afe05nite_53560 [Actinoplanes ferrugineus]
MLKPAWYLPGADWYAQVPDRPGIDDDGQDVVNMLAQMLGDNARLDPPVTVAMTYIILLAVEHLGDIMTHAVELHDLAELARLVCGLNLIQAHVTQTIQRIASNTDARAFPGSVDAPAAALRAIIDSLSAAGANSELVAGHLKEAHLRLYGLTQ